jgi:hypothetical protein
MTPKESTFARRVNEDGTIDSICRDCYVTVARSHCEADLEKAEPARLRSLATVPNGTHERGREIALTRRASDHWYAVGNPDL